MSAKISPMIDHKCIEINGITVFKHENGDSKNKGNLPFY